MRDKEVFETHAVTHASPRFFSALIIAHSPTLLAMFVGAAFLAGLARGFSGFGAALIFIPLASAIVGPRIASVVLLVVDGVLTPA